MGRNRPTGGKLNFGFETNISKKSQCFLFSSCVLKRDPHSILEKAKPCYNFWSDSILSRRRNQQVFYIFLLLSISILSFHFALMCWLTGILYFPFPPYKSINEYFVFVFCPYTSTNRYLIFPSIGISYFPFPKYWFNGYFIYHISYFHSPVIFPSIVFLYFHFPIIFPSKLLISPLYFS